MNTFEPIVGLEIHVELKTKSKMFCGCKNDPFFAKAPNIYTCPVCLGMPGALPIPNKKAVEWTIMLGLALNCTINESSKFDRKNYFYPDLPKGYQISQYDEPIAENGWLSLDVSFPRRRESSEENLDPRVKPEDDKEGKKIRIRRVHLEEDTAKLMHATVDGPTSQGLRGVSKKVSLIDFNRGGTPLVEIVTEPDIHTGEEAKVFLKKLHQIIRYLDISDADMEKGSMRIEPNISVRMVDEFSPPFTPHSMRGSNNNEALPNYKVEVKNINSFNFVKKSIEYETARQAKIVGAGETPVQETRGWDEGKNATVSQRKKEHAEDYRYFPDPDIPPMKFAQSQISNLKSQIPEMPEEKLSRFMKDYELSEYDASLLIETREKAEYFEEAIKVENGQLRVDSGQKVTPKTIANWMINRGINIDEVMPAELVKRIITATQVVAMAAGELETIIKTVLEKNPKAIADYKAGKEQSLMFLVGQVMREVKGKATAETVAQIIRESIKK